jgi:uncharacterized protein
MDPKLLEILVCPICKGPLEYAKAAQELICHADKLAYPIKDGIPVMLEDEARRLDGAAAPSSAPTSAPTSTPTAS